MLAEYLKPTPRPLSDDRSQTVGASEIGQCARRTWFTKHGTEPEREVPTGYAERGHAVEAWAMEKLREAGAPIQSVQRRFTSGFLSCTVDLTLHGEPVDLKSIDPRVTRLPKPAHVLQAQAQAGLLGAARGHLCYIDCSDFGRVVEFSFDADPVLFASLQTRAREIMTGPMPPPEGRIAGGDECEHCPFWSACLGPPVDGKGHLAAGERAQLEELAEQVRAAKADAKAAEGRTAAAKEAIREILRAADVRSVPKLVRIHRTARTQLDTEALEAAGIDLTPYRRPGRVSEVVTVAGTED